MTAFTVEPNSNPPKGAAANLSQSAAPNATLDSSPNIAANEANPRLRSLRLATLIVCLALIALCLAWELWLAPTGQKTLAIKALPLVFAIPGILRYRMYTYRWLAMLVWLYVLEGAVRAYSDQGISSQLALAEIFLSVLLFLLCSMHVRSRLPKKVKKSKK